MSDHRDRDDFSRFLAHLTRDYGESTAEDNLLSILNSQKIEARNSHCLFSPKLQSNGFSAVLSRHFNTVCFTEVPLNQLRHLAKDIPGRKIKLKPYGLVFWKQDLLNKGANPAIYVSSKSKGLRELLLSQFDSHFSGLSKFAELQKKFGEAAEPIVRYYSFINVISGKVDFSWEREWRLKGHHEFGFADVVAIIAPNPDQFRKLVKTRVERARQKIIARVPIVSPDWNYEQLVEEMARRIWAPA